MKKKIIALIFLISKLSYINYTNDAKCGRIRVVAKMELQMEDNMNSVKRVYVEKKQEFAVQAKELKQELKKLFGNSDGGKCTCADSL